MEGEEDVFLSAELFDIAAGPQDCDSPWWARLQILPLLVMFPALMLSNFVLVLLHGFTGDYLDRDVVSQVDLRNVRPVGVVGVFACDAYAEEGLFFDDGGEGGEEGGADLGGLEGELVEVADGDGDAAVDAEVVAGGGEEFAGVVSMCV